MIAVFGYLTWHSARNRLLRQLRHLRSPRYLAACLVGGAYLWTMVVHQRPTPAPGAIDGGLVELVAAVFLAGAVAWAWVFGVERRVLAFTPAEVMFLFPAPVSRRGLIRYKLLRTQLLILFNTVLWTLILSYERFDASTWLRALSIWMLLTTLSFHRLGASFVRTSLAEHGRFGARHRLASLVVVGAVLVALAWGTADALPGLQAAWDTGLPAFLGALRAAVTEPLPDALLYPFRVMVRPLAADGFGSWLLAAGPAAAVTALHYVWVIRSDAAFEEAAAEASLERVRRRAERHGGRAGAPPDGRPVVRPPFQLAPVGWAGGAILWKNLVAVLRTRRVRHAALALAVGGIVAGVLSFSPDDTLAGIAGWFALTWVGALVVIGPQWIRNDLRGDLLKLDLLRSYPVRGRTVVAAEVAASALVLTAVELSLLLFAYVAFLGGDAVELGLGMRTAIFVGAVFCLPAVNFLGMLIQNGAALLYPDWVHLGGGRPGGIEALGQNMLAMIAFVALLALALAVPVGVAGVTFVLVEPAAGLWSAVPAVIAALAVVALEAAVVVGWLGKVFDRTDPPSAGIPL